MCYPEFDSDESVTENEVVAARREAQLATVTRQPDAMYKRDRAAILQAKWERWRGEMLRQEQLKRYYNPIDMSAVETRVAAELTKEPDVDANIRKRVDDNLRSVFS